MLTLKDFLHLPQLDEVREKFVGGDRMRLGLRPAERICLSEEVVQPAAGDRLAVYSDGLTDALSPAGVLFDRPRLRALLLEQATLSPAELCEAVFERLAAYRAGTEQYDDMTLLIMALQ